MTGSRFADVLLAGLALCGHALVWVVLINRLHATGWRRRLIKPITLVFYACLVLPPAVVVAALALGAVEPAAFDPRVSPWTAPRAYAALCWALAAVHLPRWLWRTATDRPPAALAARRRRRIDLAGRLGPQPVQGRKARWLQRVPKNEYLQIEVEELELRLPGLPAAWDGLRVAHLSDLHLCGRLCRRYFEEVAEIVRLEQPDLVALAGDICEFDAQIDWIEPVLGNLPAPLGRFFVLGNHDLRVKDQARLLGALRRIGFVDLCSGWRPLAYAGQRGAIAGNARPWHGRPVVPPAEAADFRVLLAHTPDQFGWARRHGFDLVLAGHTHGGQIRLPLAGPIFCPSWHGVRFAAGTFQSGATVMHVSRGVSSLQPVRLGCPPELALVTLRCGVGSTPRRAAALATDSTTGSPSADRQTPT